MVSATNPYVTATGYDVLKSGGNAIDAMVAMQTVMTVVEPDMTGIGGGTFALYYDKQSGAVKALDGREIAPATAHPEMFLKPNGSALVREEVLGARSVAIPGTLKLLSESHKKYGSLPWKELFKPSINYARNGYTLSSSTYNILNREQDRLKEDEHILNIFWDQKGNLKKPGSIIKNPELADTLEAIADKGESYFYDGPVAKAITSRVNQLLPENSPKLSEKDFREYQIKERTPIETDYKGYTLKGFGYPASGSLMVAQTLGMLETKDLEKRSPNDAEAWRLIVEALRIARADRLRYSGDPDFINAPVEKMLSSSYLRERAKLIPAEGALKSSPPAGQLLSPLPGDDDEEEGPDTGHISIVDSKGNAIAMTSTIGTGMGAGIMVDGIVLNAQMANFSYTPERKGLPVANRAEAGKRPRSSITPVMLFNPDGSLRLVAGSPGSAQIPGFVLKTIIGIVDWKLNAQESIDLPNIQYGTKIDRSKPYNPKGLLVEQNTLAEMLIPEFNRFGYHVEVIPIASGLNVVEITENGLLGAADRRRSASSMGE